MILALDKVQMKTFFSHYFHEEKQLFIGFPVRKEIVHRFSCVCIYIAFSIFRFGGVPPTAALSVCGAFPPQLPHVPDDPDASLVHVRRSVLFHSVCLPRSSWKKIGTQRTLDLN